MDKSLTTPRLRKGISTICTLLLPMFSAWVLHQAACLPDLLGPLCTRHISLAHLEVLILHPAHPNPSIPARLRRPILRKITAILSLPATLLPTSDQVRIKAALEGTPPVHRVACLAALRTRRHYNLSLPCRRHHPRKRSLR